MQTSRCGNTQTAGLVHVFQSTALPFVNIILDIEYARAGSIRLGTHDQVLVILRDSMR